jgi:hypothetical protein
MRKSIFFLLSLFLSGILWIWYFGPNYLLPLPDNPIVKTNAIQMPTKKYFVIKESDKYAAIRIIRLTWNKGAVYECYYQGDGSGNFSSKSVIYRKGIVYEKYTETPKSPSEVLLKNKGSNLNIECGPFKIEWSAYNWIYFKGYGTEKPLFEVAPTMISDLSQLNVKDKNLNWFTRNRKGDGSNY